MEWMESGESEDYDDDTDDSGDEDSVHKYVTRRSSFTSRKRYDAPPPYERYIQESECDRKKF